VADDIVPKPDPTVLTTTQLLHEIATLKELLEHKIQANDNAIHIRLDAMVATSIARDLCRTESITKYEAFLTKQLENLANIEANHDKAIEDKISALSSRIDKYEGSKTVTSASQALLFSVVSAILTFVIGVFQIIRYIQRP